MTELNFTNDTPFAVSTSAIHPPYGGSDTWYDLPNVTINPGDTAYIGGLDDQTDGDGSDHWGWLYYYQQDSSSRELQVFADSKADGTVYGAVGPYSVGSSDSNPIPLGGAPATVDLGVASYADLTYVYHGEESGVGALGLQMELPCAMGTYVDIAAQAVRLMMVGPNPRGDDAPYLYVASADLPASGDVAGALNERSAWSVSQLILPKWVPVGDRATPSSLSRGALATSAANLVYLWNEADYSDGQISWRFLSTVYGVYGSETTWGSPIAMQDPDGNPIGAGNCGQYAPGATWFTPDVACVSCPTPGSSNTAGGEGFLLAAMLRPETAPGVAATLDLYLFDPGRVVAHGDETVTYSWAASSIQSFTAADLAAQLGLGSIDFGLGLTLDLYTTFAGASQSTPDTWLALALTDTAGTQSGLAIFPFDTDTATVGTTAAATMTFPVTSPPLVRTDTSGRVSVLWNSAPSGIEYLNTLVVPSNVAPSDGVLAGASTTQTRTVAPGQTAAAFWWMSNTGAPADPVDQGSYPQGTTATSTRYPVYRFLCYRGVPFQCAVQLVGWCEQTTGVSGSPIPPANKVRQLLRGIIDGPVPVPAVNLATQGDQGTYNTVTYGRATEQSETYEVNSSLGWGVTSSEQCTVGLGPAWNLAVTSQTTKSASTETSSGMDTYYPYGCQYDGTGQVSTLGAVLTTVATLTAQRFQLIVPTVDSNGNATPSVAGDAAVFIQFQVSFAQSISGDHYSFMPFAVAAGDLHAYTPPSITQSMRDNCGFQGADYVAEVVVPASVTLDIDSLGNGTVFELSWDNGTMSGVGTADASTNGFTEQGWSIQSSDYVGLSGGFSASASEGAVSFGIGSWNFTAMAGLLLSTSNNTEVGSGSSWQLSIDGSGPNADSVSTTNPKAGMANHYDFTMYFLPASTQWTTELITGLTATKQQQGSATIDPSEIVAGSAPWRIVFVVTNISEYDEASEAFVVTYQYTGP